MKEYYLDLHSTSCHCNNNKSINENDYFSLMNSWCELNPERFLFFLANDFHILTYHSCIEGFGYDFKKSMIEKCITGSKIYRTYEVNKSVDVAHDLKEFRLRNEPLKKYIQQVNYLYEDMTGKQYALTTTVKYLDAITNSDSLKDNYDKAKKTLTERGEDFLIKQLDELYYHNSRIFFDSEVEIIKTTEHLITKINQLSHGNN